MEELFGYSLRYTTTYGGDRVAVPTLDSGSEVMATDALLDMGLKAPRLSNSTVSKLRKILLPIASPYNPVDVTGSARDEHLIDAADILVRSGEADLIDLIQYYMTPGITEEFNMTLMHIRGFVRSGQTDPNN